MRVTREIIDVFLSGWNCVRLLTCRADAPVTAQMWENAMYDDVIVCG